MPDFTEFQEPSLWPALLSMAVCWGAVFAVYWWKMERGNRAGRKHRNLADER